MRAISFFAGLVALLCASPLIAQGHEMQEVAFAVPGEGLISLGVFNKAGKLVRTLHALDGEEAFRIGLNGYISQWDGLGDDGQKVPAGRYFLRGYLVGDVLVEGVAFHFNDWVASESAPTPRRIDDFALLPSGDLLIAGASASGLSFCARYSDEKGLLWSKELETPSTSGLLLAATDQAAVLYSSQGWNVFSLEDGSEVPNAQLPAEAKPVSLAGADGRVCFSQNGSVISVAISPGQSPAQVATPVRFDALAATGNDLAGVSDGVIWRSNADGSFEKIPIPANANTLSFGEGRTLWFTGTSMDPSATPVVAQTGFDGVILRALVPKAEDPRPVSVRASRVSDIFAVLEEAPDIQRVRVLSRNPEGGWSIEWERSIQKAPFFGFVDGNVSANAINTQQSEPFRIRLEENPLTGEHQEISLQAKIGPHGVRLETLDGLPIANVSQNPQVRRIATQRGKNPDSICLLQGDDSVVEEFLVQDLKHITPLSAGSVEIGK